MLHDCRGGMAALITWWKPNGKPKMSCLAIDVLFIHGTVALLTSTSRAGSLKQTKTLDIIQGDAIPQRFIPKLISLHWARQFPFDRLVKFYNFREINYAHRRC
jgi:aryl-alcohol dehydrogenase